MSPLHHHIRSSPAEISVVLSYGPLGFVQAITESIAQDHMQVNTGAITLNQNAEVEIMISIPGEGEHSEHHRIAAQVTHCYEDGKATLNFRCCGKNTILALRPYVTHH